MYYLTTYHISLSFFGLQLLICIISRLTAIFALGYGVKTFSQWALSPNQMAIISTSGTIRGSVAFALILTVQGSGQQEQIAVQVIKSTVLFMVFLTTIVLGGMMPWFIKVFLGTSNHGNLKDSIQVSFLEQAQSAMSLKQQKKEKKKGIFQMIDQLYLKKWLIYDYDNRKDDIKRWKKWYKMNSPQYKGAQFTGIIKANIRQTIVHQIQNHKRMKSGVGSLLQSI